MLLDFLSLPNLGLVNFIFIPGLLQIPHSKIPKFFPDFNNTWNFLYFYPDYKRSTVNY